MKRIFLATTLALLPTPSRAQEAPVQEATAFVNNFWAQWSQSNAIAIPGIVNAVSDPITFYGKPISRSDFQKLQVAFSLRWPIRSYTIEPGKLTVTCDPSGLSCTASGVVDWIDSSPERNATSKGSASFDFSIQLPAPNSYSAILITSQTGSVISRTITAYVAPLPPNQVVATPSTTPAPSDSALSPAASSAGPTQSNTSETTQPAEQPSQPQNITAPQDQSPPPQIEILALTCSFTPVGPEVQGQVKNVSDQPLSYVIMSSAFHDDKGTFVSTEDNVQAQFDPILPGQTSPFDGYGGNNPAIATVQITPAIIDGPSIPFEGNNSAQCQ